MKNIKKTPTKYVHYILYNMYIFVISFYILTIVRDLSLIIVSQVCIL